MKNLSLMIASVFMLFACNNKITPTEGEQEPKIVGNHQDEHGCNGTTGATWSELKQDCVQVFNVGTRLNPIVVKKDEAVLSAFVIENDDETQAELFLPNLKGSFILTKSEDGIYKSDQYLYNPEDNILFIDGVKSYIAE